MVKVKIFSLLYPAKSIPLLSKYIKIEHMDDKFTLVIFITTKRVLLTEEKKLKVLVFSIQPIKQTSPFVEKR